MNNNERKLTTSEIITIQNLYYFSGSDAKDIAEFLGVPQELVEGEITEYLNQMVKEYDENRQREACNAYHPQD